MKGFHIWSIAKYEIKTLTRSWFYRIFGVLAIVILFFYNMVVQMEVDSGTCDITIISAGIPYRNLLILNMAQAIIAAFLASDFLRRDKKLDSTEVIYMRSMINVDYVLGKTLGNLIVFIGLNLIVLLMVAIFNLISKTTAIDAMAYLQYLIILSIPTLVFIMGLSFLLMSVIRNQGITFILLLGYIALTVFYLKGKVFYLFDYMAYNVPMMKSDIAGFGNIQDILIHRGLYLFLGLGFIFWTVVLLKRLPQSKPASLISLVFAIIFVGSGIFLGINHIHKFYTYQKVRTEALRLNNQFAGEPVATITDHHLELKHTGSVIQVNSRISIQNTHKTALIRIILKLNPALEIIEIDGPVGPITHTRDLHLVLIDLPEAMKPGTVQTFTISYQGHIDETTCYLDMDIPFRQELSKYYQNKYGFISPEYVLLTPELNWYPTSGVSYSDEDPTWIHHDFTYFTLDVLNPNDLLAISQGARDTLSDRIRFHPDYPLPGMSLVLGRYVRRSMIIDSVEFSLYHHPAHDYFTDALPELSDTIPEIISERLHDYERRSNLTYPFDRFIIIESPVQYTSFQHIWSGGFESVQPEIVFFPEMGVGIWEANLKWNVERMQKSGKRGGPSLTQKEIEVKTLNNFAAVFTNEQSKPQWRSRRGQTQISERANPYNIFPNFFNNVNGIHSEEVPIINRVLESYLKSTFVNSEYAWMRDFSGISEDELANMALQEHSLAELLTNPEHYQIIDNVIKLKGDVLFSGIEVQSNADNFQVFLYDFLSDHQFSNISLDYFSKAIRDRFDTDMNQVVQSWFYSKTLPGYVFSPVQVELVKGEDRMLTMVEFMVSNLESVPGILKVRFRFGDNSKSGYGDYEQDHSVEKIISLEGNQTKNMSYLLDQSPRDMTILTLTSRNIPMEMVHYFKKIDENIRKTPIEREEVVADPVNLLQANEIIVDNEDPEFCLQQPESTGIFAKLLEKDENDLQKYHGFWSWRAPSSWTLTTQSGFYGKYVRSAYYVRQGNGDHRAIWNVPVGNDGHYEVFYYLDPIILKGKNYGGKNSDSKYQFFINHDDGSETIFLSLKDVSGGWNSLGSYYFSTDTIRIELTNFGEGQQVIADAVKLVYQN